MNNDLENKNEAIKYLFGELADAKLDGFEERLFVDEEFSEFLDDVENDLIDEYVRGELEFEQKREFEKKYLTTESRHERVALARTLQDELFREEKATVVATTESLTFLESLAALFRSPSIAIAGGLAILLLLVLIGGIWISQRQSGNNDIVGVGNENTPNNIAPINEVPPTPDETPTETPEANVNDTELNNENSVNKSVNPEPKTTPKADKPNINKTKVKRTPKTLEKKPKAKTKKPKENKKSKIVVRKLPTFVASLFPPLRSSENPVLKIPASTKNVRLQMFDTFDAKYERFIVELTSDTGIVILNKEVKASKKRPQKSVGVSVSESNLKAGTYEMAVKGVTKNGNIEEINYYNFVIERQ